MDLVNSSLPIDDDLGEGVVNFTDLAIPDSVLRYLCESTDPILNLTWVDSFSNFSVTETSWEDTDLQTIFRITVIGKYINN